VHWLRGREFRLWSDHEGIERAFWRGLRENLPREVHGVGKVC
jgi:hypothetical protein